MLNGNRTKSGRERHIRDYYITPEEFAREALWDVRFDEDMLYSPECLDAGCGNGVWGIEAWNGFTFAYDEDNDYPVIDGIDLEPTIPSYRLHLFDNVYTGDFLSFTFPHKYDIVFGNPPYSLAEEFIRRSYDLIEDDGYIYFLLRLSFLEGIKRGKGLFKELPLKRVYVCSRRPSFYPIDGRPTTDTLSYAMFLWQKGYEGKPEIDWLDWSYEK